MKTVVLKMDDDDDD